MIPNPLTRTSLAKNTLINIAGFGLPLVVGLATIPVIVRGFGVERFGLLTLAWAVIGYFSLFDLGIGRAITQSLAARLGTVSERDASLLAWTGLWLMLVVALIGAVAVACLTPWLVSSVLNMPEAIREEAVDAFMLLSIAIPFVVLTAGLSGVLSALQRFDLINALRIPLGVMIFLVPLGVLPYSDSMADVCAGLLLVRVAFLIFHVLACSRAFPPLFRHRGIARQEIKGLLKFGGWMTVTNIVGPLMIYMDRFIIGSVLTISAVAYYVTPYEMVTRLWAIPTALVAVLFPAFAAARSEASTQVGVLYSMGARAILALLTPLVLVLVIFAEEGLRFWLGDDFARQSAVILQWLAIGVFINSYAQVPFAFIQGAGRADITAKLHLLELPLYLVVLYALVLEFGIAGVAIAWVLRISFDAVLMTMVAHRLSAQIALASKEIYLIFLLPLALFFIGMTLGNSLEKLMYAGFAAALLCLVGYNFALRQDEKNAVHMLAQRIFRT